MKAGATPYLSAENTYLFFLHVRQLQINVGTHGQHRFTLFKTFLKTDVFHNTPVFGRHSPASCAANSIISNPMPDFKNLMLIQSRYLVGIRGLAFKKACSSRESGLGRRFWAGSESTRSLGYKSHRLLRRNGWIRSARIERIY